MTDPSTYFQHLSLSTEKDRVSLDEPISFEVKFSISGSLRDSFRQEAWESAYNKHDNTLRVRYDVEIYRKAGGILKSSIVKPKKLWRKATLYWSRNPELPYRIWAMIIDENGRPSLPGDEEEAKRSLFDGNLKFGLLGSDIGRGKHTIQAQLRTRWGKHSYLDQGDLRGSTNKISLECS